MLLAVDGTGEAYRHYYALPRYLREASYSSQTEFNEDVGGLFAHVFMSGILTAIKRIERNYTSEALTLICWDLADSKAERLDRFPAYKQHRHRSENIQLFVQMLESFRTSLAAVGPQFDFHCPRWEADDLIAFMPVMAEAVNTELVILSKDSDFKQLLRTGVAIYDPDREQLLDEVAFQEENGYSPDWALAYKVLVGDVSDNWRGLSGIGKVKATKMIAQAIADGHTATDWLEELCTEHPELRVGRSIIELPPAWHSVADFRLLMEQVTRDWRTPGQAQWRGFCSYYDLEQLTPGDLAKWLW